MYAHDIAYLEHHGIIGMHWGIRKAETAAAYRQSADHMREESKLAERITKSVNNPSSSFHRSAMKLQNDLSYTKADRKLLAKEHKRLTKLGAKNGPKQKVWANKKAIMFDKKAAKIEKILNQKYDIRQDKVNLKAFKQVESVYFKANIPTYTLNAGKTVGMIGGALILGTLLSKIK